MDTPSLITLTSASSVAVTLLLYTLYRLCRHFHLRSRCCGQDTELDFDTSTPPDEKELLRKLTNPLLCTTAPASFHVTEPTSS